MMEGRLLTTHATSGGSNSTIMCQDIVMTFGRPIRRQQNDRSGLQQLVSSGRIVFLTTTLKSYLIKTIPHGIDLR